MADRPDEEEQGQGSSTEEQPDEGSINDPLTRADVQAPRKEFGSDPGD